MAVLFPYTVEGIPPPWEVPYTVGDYACAVPSVCA